MTPRAFGVQRRMTPQATHGPCAAQRLWVLDMFVSFRIACTMFEVHDITELESRREHRLTGIAVAVQRTPVAVIPIVLRLAVLLTAPRLQMPTRCLVCRLRPHCTGASPRIPSPY